MLRRLLALLILLSAPAWAAGVLTHLSGPVSVRKADGSVHAGQAGVKVGTGDTVITGPGGYVRVEMTDGGEMVLRPDSQLKVESYAFVQAKPAEDNMVFSMLKGGIRTVTGLIGKRGNKDAYELKTPTATVGIRGTQFDARICQGDCGALADGTYLAVRFGAIQTTNAQGSLPVNAGQVAHVPPQKPPVMLPRDPGIGFTPPPVIPKLDEKKKQQAQQAAASPAKPVEQKPEPKQEPKQEQKPEQKSESKGEQKQEAKTETKSETKTEASGTRDTPPAKASLPPPTPQLAPGATPAVAPLHSSGPDCSVL